MRKIGHGRYGDTVGVLQRALILALLGNFANGLDQHVVADSLDEFHLMDVLSPNERACLDKAHHTYLDLIAFDFAYGASSALLWALGLCGNPQLAAHCTEFEHLIADVYSRGFRNLVAEVRWRKPTAIAEEAHYYDAYQQIYRADLSTTDRNQTSYGMEYVIGPLDAYIVTGLQRAFAWITTDSEWDETK
ncbi:DUF4272 domain-containing protein [Streptomyces sp. NPDC086783]|uniref:DUF4272 domain-containing protein n=1 Tax=Streptomyces sp. NPDC086783 TaxID=3365758 RepID=UPI0038233BDB